VNDRRLLRLHAILSTLALVFLFATGAADPPESTVFDRITVRQIDVVDSMDRVRVQLAGEFGPRRTDLSGLLFHNEDGNEAGGLVYSGKRDENGEIEAGAILTFDQYADVLPTIPREELPAKRLYFGRTQDNSSTIDLYDPQGRVRLKMEVGEDGVPRIEFFDEQGESIKKISI